MMLFNHLIDEVIFCIFNISFLEINVILNRFYVMIIFVVIKFMILMIKLFSFYLITLYFLYQVN